MRRREVRMKAESELEFRKLEINLKSNVNALSN